MTHLQRPTTNPVRSTPRGARSAREAAHGLDPSRASASGRFGTSLVASAGIHGGVLAAAVLAGLATLRPTAPDGAPRAVVHTAHPPAALYDEPLEVLRDERWDPDADYGLLDEPRLVEVTEPPVPMPFQDVEPDPAELIDLLDPDLDLDWVVEVAPEEPTFVEPESEAVDPPEVVAAEPVEVESVLLESPTPRYPRVSIRRGEEGTVQCRMFVSVTGSVERVEVVRSSGFGRLDEAAVEALLRWRFVPRTEGGRAVPDVVDHPVTFQLETD